MSLKSLIYPNTSQIPMKGSVRINSPLIKRDWDDAFRADPNATLWTTTVSGATKLGTDPLKYSLDASSTIAIVGTNTIPNNADNAFCVQYSFGYELTSGSPANHIPYVFSLSEGGVTVIASFGLIWEGGVFKLRFEDSGTTYKVTSGFSVENLNLRLLFDGSQFTALYMDTNGDWQQVGQPIVATQTDVWEYRIDAINLNGSKMGETTFYPLQFVPTIYGIDEQTMPDGHPSCIATYDNAAHFKIHSGHPGEFSLSLYGSGSAIGTAAETETLEVIDPVFNDKDISFVTSDVEDYYLSGDVVTACPTVGKPGSENSGNLILHNDCCFCDGSTLHDDPIKVLSKSFGKFDQYSNRKNTPEFVIEDRDGKEYSLNLDFQRIHVGDQTLQLADDTFRIIGLRQLNLSDGKRVYYGLQADPLTNQNVTPDITYGWSADQLASTGAAIDNFEWELCEEDGTVIDSASGINYTNYTDPSNVPSTQLLSKGRYYFKITAYGEGPTVSADGANARVAIHQGTLTSDPVMAEGYAECLGDDTGVVEWETGICYINFEIKDFRSQFVVYVFDPCNSTMARYEGSTFDISNRSDSFGAFENESGDVVLVYQHASTDYLYDHRSDSLSYRLFDVDNGTFSSRRTINLPDGEFGRDGNVYAFDVNRVGDKVNFFFSVEREIDYFEPPDEIRSYGEVYTSDSLNKRSIPYSPTGDSEIVKVSTFIGRSEWDGTKDSLLRHYEKAYIKIDSLGNVMAYDRPNILWDASHPTYHPFASTLRVNRNEGFELDVVSALEMQSRVPLILAGGENKYNEVMIPMHFNSREYFYDIFGPTSFYEKSSLGLDSFDAVMHYDGMIYSAASKGQRIELGVCDPKLMWEARSNYSNQSDTPDILSETTFYSPEFKFISMPVVSIGEADDSTTRILVSLQQQQQYTTMCVGEDTYSARPTIYQSGMWDELPFETTNERVWYGELENNPTFISDQSATYQKDEGYGQIQSIGDSTFTYSFIQLQLTEASTYQHAHMCLNRGVKCHWRAKIIPASGNTKLDRPIQLFATLADFYDESDLGSLGSPYFTADVRIFFDGEEALFQHYDWWSGSPGWVTDKTVSGLDPTLVYDFYVLVQRFDTDKYKVAYIIKHQHHVQDTVDGVETNFDFKNELIAYHLEDYIRGRDFYSTEQSDISAIAGVTGDPTDLLEYAHIYEMGWNHLNARSGPYTETVVTKGGSPYTVYTDGSLSTELGAWRRFNDAEVFGYGQSPTYPFRVGYLNEVGYSQKFHWWNKFRFRFSGSVSGSNDEWTLQREYLNQPDTLLSKGGAGIWITSTDQNQVTIWADSEDSDLEKFRADTFIVDGANVNQIRVVGKDNEGDPWTTIGIIDLTRYRTSSASFDNVSGNVYCSIPSANFAIGKFAELDHYLIEDTNAGRNAIRLTESDGDTIYGVGEDGATYSDTNASIFVSRGLLKLDDYEEYRYIGFQLDAFDTNEGYFKLHSLDFGMSRVVPVNTDISTGYQMELEGEVDQLVAQQSVDISPSKKVRKSYALSYSLLDARSFMMFTSMFDELNLRAKPVWVLLDPDETPHKLFLGLIEGEPSHEILIDEDGDKEYRVDLEIRSVEE